MSFQFIQVPTQDDRGGSLTVRATGTDSILDAVEVFKTLQYRSDILEIAELVKKGQWEFTLSPTPSYSGGLRAWYEVEGYLSGDFVKVYHRWLQLSVGYGDLSCLEDWPTIDLMPNHPDPVKPTFITDELVLMPDSFWFKIYLQSESEQRARFYGVDLLAESVGMRRVESEFIAVDSVRYKANPSYPMTRHNASPARRGWIAQALLAWWKENKATEDQKNAMSVEASYP